MNKLYLDFAAIVKRYDTILIYRRDNPDANAYGSQLGLKEIIKFNFPEKNVYALGSNTDYLNPLGRMDRVDYKIVSQSLGIIVDCPTSAWIDDQSWKQCKEIIKIDDHPEKEVYGILDLNDQTKSTCSELIADLAFSLKWNLTSEAAQCLLIGILEGTSNFWTSTFSKSTFLTLAKLVELSSDVQEILNRRNYVSRDEISLKKFIVKHIKETSNNTTMVYVPYSRLKRRGIDPNRAATFFSTVVDFSVTEFSAMFIEYPNKTIRALFVSKTRPINNFVTNYGGWGTEHSAGAFLKGKKAMKEIITNLDEETF